MVELPNDQTAFKSICVLIYASTTLHKNTQTERNHLLCHTDPAPETAFAAINWHFIMENTY